MYKIIFVTLSFLLAAPFFVSADSYDGPYCFEKPGIYFGNPNEDVTGGGIRGTCKEIEIKTVVSLDPALQKDYFLGTHSPIEYNCERYGCENSTKYSEHFFLTSSSTLQAQTIGVEESPLQYALFEKKYFIPSLSKMFKDLGVSFIENSMTNIRIDVLNKSELDGIKGLEYSVPKDAKMDSLNAYDYLPGEYTVYSYNYKEYGKYIYAPKNILVESQYADFEKAGNILNDKDLQIKSEGGRNSVNVVLVTSPLKSIANYWIYTKKGGKLTLFWQKSEYALDNGQVKVVTNADKNITTALLFSNDFPRKDVATTSVSNNVPATLPTEQKKGFFSRLFDFFSSWFK